MPRKRPTSGGDQAWGLRLALAVNPCAPGACENEACGTARAILTEAGYRHTDVRFYVKDVPHLVGRWVKE